MANESAADKAVKAAQKALDAQVFVRYAELTEAEIKSLVIDDKWQATLAQAIQDEIERVTQALTNRVTVLEERYADPLPHLAEEVGALTAKVAGHLERMGVAW